jgi:hypothetical protein
MLMLVDLGITTSLFPSKETDDVPSVGSADLSSNLLRAVSHQVVHFASVA